MNLNLIKAIYKFNEEAGLLDKPYSDEKECAFPIEESLEGFELKYLLTALNEKAVFPYSEPSSPKELSREITTLLAQASKPLSDVDRLDKHLDIIVYSFGSIFKLGLSPQQAQRCLDIVMQANMTKLNAGQDDHGKQMKPADFVGPEAELQKILDERE